MVCGMTLYQILWYFMIYSVIGWMIEVSYHAITLGKVVNRGFLNGPVCPVYGSGVLMVLFVLFIDGQLFGFETDLQKASTLGLFVVGIIFASLIELIAGFALDRLFHARWWDYRDRKFNLNGYICLEFSIIWGLGIAFVLRVVQPSIEGVVSLIPHIAGIILLVVFYLTFACDMTLTVLTILKFNKQLKQMQDLEAAIRHLSDDMSEVIGNGTIKTMEKIEDGQKAVEKRSDELKEVAEKMKEDIRESADAAREEMIESGRRYMHELEDKKDRLKADYEHLKKSLMYHRLFGMGRLMESLAPRGHALYQDMIDKIRRFDMP